MQAMLEASGVAPPMCKYVIAVDDDVDIQSWEDINWALCYHCQPARDVLIVPHTPISSKISTSSPSSRVTASSKMFIDATRKWKYPAVGRPPKDMVRGAARIGHPTDYLLSPRKRTFS